MNHKGKNVKLVRCKKHGGTYFYCLGCGSDLSTTPRGRRNIGVHRRRNRGGSRGASPPYKNNNLFLKKIIISMIISHCRGVVLFVYTWVALRQGNLRSFFTVKAGSK